MAKNEINNSGNKQQNPREKKKPAKTLFEERRSERGAAMLVALIVIVAFIVLVSAASRTVTAISREAERVEQIRQEKARAEYYMSMAEATLKYDVRQSYNNFQARGKQKELQLQGDGKLPMFDPLTAPSSRPLLTVDGEHTGESPATATSLYGTVNPWSSVAIDTSRQYISSKIQEKGITAPDGIEILSFKEVYRRIMPGVTEPIYAFRYTVRAHSGEFGEVVREDTIHLGPAILEDSPTVVNCSDLTLAGVANPANVIWGSTTSLELTYSNAETVNIYNSGGASIFNQSVTNEPTPRTVAYTTGALTGPTSFVGEALRGTCRIQVPINVGVSFNQNLSYTVNGVQTVNIIEGENVRYDWNVTNASSGYTTSYITYGSDPVQYHANVYSNSITVPGPLASTTSTLYARDTRYNGGAEQTVTVNINVCRLPRILGFSVNPATVTQGGNQSVQFTWQTAEAAAVRIIRLSDNQEIYSGNQATGTFILAQPQASTQYRLEAISSCGAPTATSAVAVTVQPPSCQIPAITNFTVNPNAVTIGGNESIVFNYSASGDIDSQSIDQGIGAVTGNTLSIIQPQATTTYTYSVVGCGQTRQAQVTVTATSAPGPCPAPVPGQPLAGTGGGGGGSASLPGFGNSYTRIRYVGGYYADGTLRFNLQFEASGSTMPHSMVASSGDSQVEIPGKLKVRFNPVIANGVDIYDGSNNFIGHYNWENITGSGYRTYALRGSGDTIVNGVILPFPNFDLNDRFRVNNFSVNAQIAPPNNTPLNTGVSGGLSSPFSCS